MSYKIAAFYRFTPFADPRDLRARLIKDLFSFGLCGTLLLAPEGLNGTIACAEPAMDQVLRVLNAYTGLILGEVKFSESSEKPFQRFKIRLKREIITFKQPSADPTKLAGTYVEAHDWNTLLEDPDVLLLDTRNNYETRIGTFRGAAIPPIKTFIEFADYVRRHLNPTQHKKIAMFCTGGIRCEKASSFMRAEGFEEVYHLKGGILKYLEEIPPEESKWNGECYVFDRRVAVGHGLTTGHYVMCFTCGAPLTEENKKHELFEEGVSCHLCYATTSTDDKKRFRMRQHQIVAENQERQSNAVD